MCIKRVARPDLPEEILFYIFSFLPAKSIGKFRCLSKTWLNLLSTPHFIKSHLSLQNTHPKSLILITPSQTISCIETVRDEYNDTVSREINLPGPWREVLGSCDGLVLLLDEGMEMYLVNPITLEQYKILYPSVDVLRYDSFYGVGYDSVRDDHNVVAVYFQMSDDKEPVYVDTLTYVYSVKRGVWIKLENTPREYSLWANKSGAVLNGAIHWFVDTTENCPVITALDLKSDLFFEIPAPSVADVNSFLFGSLLVLGGYLCVVDTMSNREGTDVWIMKDYGVAESWKKYTISGYRSEYYFQPLCFIGDEEDEFVLLIDGPRLVVYNVKDGALREMDVDRGPGIFVEGGTFVESLVSPRPVNPYADRRV